jgi:hypothetical protein
LCLVNAETVQVDFKFPICRAYRDFEHKLA